MSFVKKNIIKSSLLCLVFWGVNAQQYLSPEYIKVTNERASKIVAKLALPKPEKEQKVTLIIAQQFRNLTKIQDERDAEIEKIKNSGVSKEQQTTQLNQIKEKADQAINELHTNYVKQLTTELDENKIIEVKDGMTYGVVPITYAGYQDMLPNLTEDQKKYIYTNLVEAREHAMDGGTSKEKHAWFGKYKGRINNYLSSQGYDLNKESTDWHKRIEDRQKSKVEK
ncbi:DUF3826 domain-containing protein [Flavobacterium sp.]|jgi:hypothetical protein|uniref:DUF3826 domain-containing protein n=1 Tax=Flavobacterium sp. TaxID=239 RepID=UPI0025EB4AA7|nr:DUF3826 domain-containing protein [Flavobacterium sp.]